MKAMRLFFVMIITCLFGNAGIFAQTSYQLDFVGSMTFPADPSGCGSADTTGGTDVWGYTAPDGSEYAIMGVRDGIAVVKVPEMELIDLIDGPSSFDCYYHRDIKTYGHYAFAVAEMYGPREGLMILDLQYLPDSVRYVRSYTALGETISHNLTIDEATGFAYLCSNNDAGVRVVDINDPENPVDVFKFNVGRAHDLYARNDTLIISEGSQGKFSIWDMSVKNIPVRLVRFGPPNAGYAHNAWLTDDGKYLMTTEETIGKTLKMWDIQDLGNISLLGQYLGASNIAHNTHIMGNLAFVSHYKSGVSVVDISDPNAPAEVAVYDTYPLNDNTGFEGNWGVFPYTQNGYVYASDMNGKLTVLKLQITTGIGDQPDVLPSQIELAQNFPNPFNPATQIQIRLPEMQEISLKIYDLQGRLVTSLSDGIYPAGSHSFIWNGRNNYGESVASGVYVYTLQAGNAVFSKKMVLVE